VIAAGIRLPVPLTQVLDANGNPLLDAVGDPLYVKTLDVSRQIVEFVNNGIQPYLDAVGDSINVTEPLDAGGHPFTDPHGNSILVLGRNIDASGSGVIGSTVNLDASGNVSGFVFARGNASVSAQQNVDVTVLAAGDADVNAGGGISGTVIGLGGINAVGGTIDASLLSQNISASGDVTSSQVGFAQGTAANSTSQSMQSDQSAAAAASNQDDESNKKKEKPIALAQKVSRVTVLLPPKTLSENQNSRNPL
jgi:hypothetical protein